MSSEMKHLYRSRHSRMVGGVCGGLGEFLGIDPTLVRLIFVLGVFFGFGSFFFIYIILLLLVPENPLSYYPAEQISPHAPTPVEPVIAEPDSTAGSEPSAGV